MTLKTTPMYLILPVLFGHALVHLHGSLPDQLVHEDGGGQHQRGVGLAERQLGGRKTSIF